MGIPHFLAIPFPVLGHVNPLMQFSHVLAKHGCKITFLNTEFSHKRAMTASGASQDQNQKGSSHINVVTLPDGLGPEDDRSDIVKVLFSIKRTMPNLLPKLIEDINALDVENKVTCILVTINMGWALEVGHKLGIKGAFLCPASATSLASLYCIPRLVDQGIIDSDGIPTKKQVIELFPNMPLMDTTHFPWGSLGKVFYNNIVQEMQTLKVLAEWWLCNTAYDLEPATFSISPKLLPIGPLMEESDDNNKSSFWLEDTTCLDWLDQQQPQSVIYVSFGSLAVLESNQFKELALALDLIEKPFLWVVRDNNNNPSPYPAEFHGSRGKIVNWAPQKKVLNHPAIACFVSHCGWNSTVEGVYSGVPFLCWPFFTDQFLDKSYICDVWEVGMGLDKDENGFITKEEIKKKVEKLLGDEGIRERSLKLKEVTKNNVVESGQSSKNIEKFINWAI